MPHWLAPWVIAGRSQGEMELSPSVIPRGNAKKKCQERVNTRENRQIHPSKSLWLQPAARAHSVVLSGNYWCCSFSPIKVSQKCSQLIHMRFVPVLASGLETRNRFQNRQEKNKFYFSLSTKNFLTRKLKRACAREKQNGRSGPISPHAWPPPIGNQRGELPSLIAPCAALLS